MEGWDGANRAEVLSQMLALSQLALNDIVALKRRHIGDYAELTVALGKLQTLAKEIRDNPDEDEGIVAGAQKVLDYLDAAHAIIQKDE